MVSEALLLSASNWLQGARRVMPRPLFDRGGSESVDAHNGRKGAKLDPTHEELTLARLIEKHVNSDIYKGNTDGTTDENT
jgi:hypothetical protein